MQESCCVVDADVDEWVRIMNGFGQRYGGGAPESARFCLVCKP